MKIKGIFYKPGINGLGVRGFHRLPYRKRFDKAARKHDECYDTRGDRESRKAYDLLFLCSCLSVSDTALQCMVAYVYYALVRLFGWAFYRYDR